jgi:hypothetical protein
MDDYTFWMYWAFLGMMVYCAQIYLMMIIVCYKLNTHGSIASIHF